MGYLVGSVNGVVAYETVAFGPHEISQQAIGEFHSHSTKARSFMDTPALVNETRDLNLSSAGNSGVMGLSFPSTAVIPQTAGRTLLENVLSHFDDDRHFSAFRLGRDLRDSSLTFGQLDPSIANDSGSFAYACLSRVSVYS